MVLIESLLQNFASVQEEAEVGPPQNLRELRQLLQSACQRGSFHQDLSFYCGWYAQFLSELHAKENKTMGRMRGQARRMWAEQSLIYQDLINLLQDLQTALTASQATTIAEMVNELYALVDELSEAVQDMEDWLRSEDARCLNCGWSGSTGHCPHCHLQILKPVRQVSTHINQLVALAPAQAQLYTAIVAIMEGRQDVSTLLGPIQLLQQRYEETRQALAPHQHPVAEAGLRNIERGQAGLGQILRVFQDGDAQHLENGWAMIFEADQANLATAAEAAPSAQQAVAVAHDIIRDQVSFTNE